MNQMLCEVSKHNKAVSLEKGQKANSVKIMLSCNWSERKR